MSETLRKTLIDLIRAKFPNEVAEFDAAPWDYNIIASCSLDDEPAQFIIYLKVGTTKQEKLYVFKVYATDAEVEKE